MEEVRTNKALNPKAYKLMPLDQIGLALPQMPPYLAATVFKMREKDFGKNPEELIKLLKAAETSPTLKAIIHDSKLVQSIERNEIKFNRTNLEKAQNLLKHEQSEATTDLKNTVNFKYYSKIPRNKEVNGQNLYEFNPKSHQRASIEALTNFLKNNPEHAFYFLRQRHRQREFTENPILIAKMIALGDSNLHRTLQKEGVLQWNGLNSEAKSTLELFLETKKYLDDPLVKKNPMRGELNQRLESMVKEHDGPTLSAAAVTQLNKDVKQTVIAEIQTALNQAPLNGSPEGAALKEKLSRVTAFIESDWKNSALKEENFSAILKDPSMTDALKLNHEVKLTAEKVTLLGQIKSALEHPLLQKNKAAAVFAERSSTLSNNSDVKEIQQLKNEVTQLKNDAIKADQLATQQKIAALTKQENTHDKKAAQSLETLHKKTQAGEEKKAPRKKRKIRVKKKIPTTQSESASPANAEKKLPSTPPPALPPTSFRR